MAENLLHKKSFYPGASTNWIYLSTLGNQNQQLSEKATNLISNTKNKIFSSGQRLRLRTLETLLRHEREKEKRFFEYFDVKFDPQQEGEYIHAMHRFLQTEDVLEQNLSQLAANKSNIDVTKSFPNIYEKHLHEWITQNGVDKLNGLTLEKITLDAIAEMYTKELKGKKNPYSELWEYLQKEGKASPIVETILHYFLNISTQDIADLAKFEISAQSIREKMAMDNAHQFSILTRTMARPVGYLIEQQTKALLDKRLAKVPGVKVEHTGAADNMKADTLVTFNFDLPEDWLELTEKEASVRARNITRLQNLHSKMQEGKNQFILEISDKSYSINDNFEKTYGGFSAQNNVTLNNLEKTFNKMQVKLENGTMKQLLFALAHIGENLLTQKDGEQQAEKYLASKIAYFMFDDIGVDQVKNELNTNYVDNAIHVFNLNGIYVPLSVYLNALYKAIRELEGSGFENYAKVDIIDDNKIDYTPYNQSLTQPMWDKVRKERYEQEIINIHFMKNFRALMVSLLNK